MTLMVLALAVAVAACGSDDESSGGAVTLNWFIFNEPSGGPAKAAERCSQQSNGAYKINFEYLPAQADQQREQLVRRLGAKDPSLDLLGLDVVWTGEFGRTPYDQDLGNGKGSPETRGRDHNPHCWTMWMAGAGVKGGTIFGKTDEYGYRVIENEVTVHDLHATIMHLLGLDHKQLTFRFGGRDMRLTDVHGNLVKDILA